MKRQAPLPLVEQASRDLAWLLEVRAIRSLDRDEDGVFVVELPSRQLCTLTVDQVAPFRAGVLAGWRLPRAEGVMGAL